MYMYLVFCLIVECKFVFGTTSRNFVDLEPVDCGLQSNGDHDEVACTQAVRMVEKNRIHNEVAILDSRG